MTKAQKAIRDEAIADLRKILKPGSTVYTICTHVSSSGMTRRIRTLILEKDGPREISHYVARILGHRRNDRDGGIVVGGCGMDMGFHLVNRLSYALHGWKAVGDAVKEEGKGIPFNKTRPGHYRAGYSLNHRWM